MTVHEVEREMTKRVLLVADSVDRLRACDVFRLLDWYADDRERMAEWLTECRPDLRREVGVVLEELAAA